MGILKYWLRSEDGPAVKWREQASNREWAKALVTWRHNGDDEDAQETQSMRTLVTERVRVDDAREKLEAARAELEAAKEKHAGWGETYPLHKEQEYMVDLKAAKHARSKVDSAEKGLQDAEESLALVRSDILDLEKSAARYEDRTGPDGLYARLIDEARNEGERQYYEKQRQDELASLKKTRARLARLKGE